MADALLFLDLIERLKGIERRGWVLRGVPKPESVADHMYRMAVICLAVPKLDEETRTKAVYMALVHDMGEALAGDITPSDGVTADEKHTREEMALEFLSCTIRTTNSSFAERIMKLWYEYEKGETKVARLVRQVDKLECLQQAVIYEERTGKDMSDFLSLREKVTLPELKPILEQSLQSYARWKSRKQEGLVVIFVTGGPGVGKGTQCDRLAKELRFHHISVGELLRQEAESLMSPYKDFILKSFEKSIVIPAQLTTYLLKREMELAQTQGKHGFLLDGFPRSIEQVADFEQNICRKYCTLSFDCSESDLRRRLEHRSKSSNRTDDDFYTIGLRLRAFEQSYKPVLQYLREHGPVYPIDCQGSVDDIHNSLLSVVESILRKPETE